MINEMQNGDYMEQQENIGEIMQDNKSEFIENNFADFIISLENRGNNRVNQGKHLK